jgi:hypothetical protein
MCRPQGYRGCQGIYGPWIRTGSQEGEGLGTHVLNVEDKEPVYPRHAGALPPAPRYKCTFFVLSFKPSEDLKVHLLKECN